MAKHVKRSVIPIYLVGVVWLVFGLGLRLYQPVDYILCALVSVAAFVVGKAIFPDKSYQIAGGEDEEEKQAEQEAQKRAEEAHAAREKAQAEREERQRREQEEKARQAQQAKSTGNPEIDKLILERERALSEMRRLNDSIEDETISAQIDHLEEVTRKIIDQVIQDPKKLPQIRRFLNYFLPTTLKILNAYDRMDAVGISGENIDATKAKVEAMMGTIVKAFDKQLDSLFGAEAMDISTDITPGRSGPRPPEMGPPWSYNKEKSHESSKGQHPQKRLAASGIGPAVCRDGSYFDLAVCWRRGAFSQRHHVSRGRCLVRPAGTVPLGWQRNGAWNAAFSCAPCYWSADSQWSGRKSCDAGAVDYPGALFHMDADPVV